MRKKMMKPRPLEIVLGMIGLALMSIGIAAHVRSISAMPTARVQASVGAPAVPRATGNQPVHNPAGDR
jgi:hypothetical protein